jgi:hypothetical protein
MVEIQFGSQVTPSSAEKACSNVADVGVMSDHR